MGRQSDIEEDVFVRVRVEALATGEVFHESTRTVRAGSTHSDLRNALDDCARVTRLRSVSEARPLKLVAPQRDAFMQSIERAWSNAEAGRGLRFLDVVMHEHRRDGGEPARIVTNTKTRDAFVAEFKTACGGHPEQSDDGHPTYRGIPIVLDDDLEDGAVRIEAHHNLASWTTRMP